MDDDDRERAAWAPPGPLSDEDAGIEARIRLKLDRREPLTDEERAFFARMPADKGRPPLGTDEARKG